MTTAQEVIDLDKFQLEAWKEFVKAYKKCIKRKIYFYQVISNLYPLNGKNVNFVDSPEFSNEYSSRIGMDVIRIGTGAFPSKGIDIGSSFDSDFHYAILTDSGKKLLCNKGE